MARVTRAEQREQTRTRLMAAAADVVARVGFEAAAIDVIANEAGYSRGAFYSNFESKDDLFLEILGAHLAAEIETLGRALDRIDEAAKIADVIEKRYRILGEDNSWCLLMTEFQLYALRGGRRSEDFVRLYADYRQRLGGLIENHFVRLGVRSRLSAYEFGVAQIALSHGLALARATDGELDSTLPSRALALFALGALEN